MVLLQILTIWTYIHTFMHSTGNKLVICQLENRKSNFPKFCKVYVRQKTNLMYLYIHYLCFSTSFKVCFQEAFLLKVINPKQLHYMQLINEEFGWIKLHFLFICIINILFYAGICWSVFMSQTLTNLKALSFCQIYQ